MCVCTEMEELRSQVSRLQSRNRELELQSSGRNSDHARQIRQVSTHTHAHMVKLQCGQKYKHSTNECAVLCVYSTLKHCPVCAQRW